MEHTTTGHTQEHHGGGSKEVWQITGLLTLLTLVELALGFWMMKVNADSMRWTIKGVIVILMLAKAFYIVAYFMHLKHEIRNMIMTIVMPLLLFIWFIAAFLYEGNSYKHLRNTYDAHFRDAKDTKAPVTEEGHKEKEK